MSSHSKKLTPFGKLVVKALTDRDMSKSELARAIGTTPPYLSYIPYGQRTGEKYLPAVIATLDRDAEQVSEAMGA